MISAIRVHGGSLSSIRSRLRVKTPFFGSPPVTPEFWRELNLRTHMCSESPSRELQDAPMISAIGACGGRTWPIQWCLRVKTPHFDGLVCTPLTGPRISMATHTCLESPLYTVSENTIKSGIRFILGSLYRFWLKSCSGDLLSESDPPYKIMREWLYYSTQLSSWFPDYRNLSVRNYLYRRYTRFFFLKSVY